MTREALLCASNSVDWYEAILRPHGLAGAVADGIWTCREILPPYYSNAVSLAPTGLAAQVEAIRELEAALGRSFSAKDSFALLDLAPLGFRPLFGARWIWRDPADPPSRTAGGGADWRPVADPGELERWEAAWRESGSPAGSRVFLPDLLASGAVALFAARRGGRTVAGCAANRSDGVVGLSNFFAADPDPDPLLAEAVGQVARFAPGLPMAGFERGGGLARARRLGFRDVGPLRVWVSHGA